MIVEYKPPHKLSVFNLRAGLLRADNGSMNLLEDVINQITIPTDSEKKFVYNSECPVANRSVPPKHHKWLKRATFTTDNTARKPAY